MQLLRGAQETDDKFKALACFLKFGLKPLNPNLRWWATHYAKSTRMNEQGLLTDMKNRILIPPALKETVLRKAHDEMGHYNWERTLANLGGNFV